MKTPEELLDGLDFAKLEALAAARLTNPNDPHTAVAAEYYGVKIEDVTTKQRRMGKALNLYLYYSAPLAPPKARVSRRGGFIELDTLMILVILAMIIGCVALIFHLGREEQKRWDKFKTEHHCVVSVKLDGDYISTVAFDAKGQPVYGTTRTSDKVGWKCDDGITYIR